ncbi:hypothetical protein ACA910_010435 [Epithemia clementina (nom. ined.)]
MTTTLHGENDNADHSSLAAASSSAAAADTTTKTVWGTFQYVHPSTTVAHLGRDTTGDDAGTIQNATWTSYTVQVEDVRGRTVQPTLQVNGVQLTFSPLYHHSNNDNNNDIPMIDFLDQHDVLQRYYPHCEGLVRQCLTTIQGKDEEQEAVPYLVRAFDHNVRIHAAQQPPALKNAGDSKTQTPLCLVHGDYTDRSAPRRLEYLSQPPRANDVWRSMSLTSSDHGLLDPQLVQEAIQGDDETGTRRRRRFAIINVWRNIDPIHPVRQWPLACVDATTLSPETDVRTLQIQYTDRIGENYLVTYNASHNWMYWSDMTHDEALVLKQWDSAGTTNPAPPTTQAQAPPTSEQTQEQKEENNNNNNNNNNKDNKDDTNKEDFVSTFCIHSAFELPGQELKNLERRSIEVRCVVIY